jgi:hypothetical protein
MGKQKFNVKKKTTGILLAVLFLVALTASVGAASCSACDSCGSSCPCDDSCSSCNACDDSCSSCNACDSCSACDSCHACGPTWQDWFKAFKNDGFDTWSGINSGSFANWFNL